MPNNIYLEDYKKIINKLKQARLSSGLTQSEAAGKLNKPQSYISKSENGDRRIDITEIKKMAALYKKDVSFFIK